MRISDCSSYLCSSDLSRSPPAFPVHRAGGPRRWGNARRASGRTPSPMSFLHLEEDRERLQIVARKRVIGRHAGAWLDRLVIADPAPVGRAWWREREGQDAQISGGDGGLKKKK